MTDQTDPGRELTLLALQGFTAGRDMSSASNQQLLEAAIQAVAERLAELYPPRQCLDEAPAPVEDEIVPGQHVAADAMIGDLMRVLLAQVRTLDKPWAQLLEHRQSFILNAWEDAITMAVRKAARHIAAHEVDAVLVTLEQVTMQGGKVQGTLAIPPRTEGLHDLADAAVDSKDVLVVLPGDIELWNGGELPRATPDNLEASS